jgi:uncharacterized membrane protein
MTDTRIGPVQLLALDFETDQLSGRISQELRKLTDHHGLLHDRSMLRLLDLLVLAKDAMGNFTRLRVSDLTDEQAARYGALAGGLLGLGVAAGYGAGSDTAAAVTEAAADAGALTFANFDYGLTDDQLEKVADAVPANTTVAIAIIEHRWAIDLKEAIRDAGGIVLASGLVSAEALLTRGALVGDYLAYADQQATAEPV